MTRTQLNKFTMYQVVIGTSELYPTQITSIPALENSINAFKTLVEQIKLEHQVQIGRTTGITLNKAELRRKLAEKAMLVSGACFAYATDQKDLILQAAIKFRFNKLFKERESEMITDCCNILDESTQVISDLKNYGITTQEINEFQSLIDLFASVADDPRVSRTKGATATQQLGLLFDLADDKLYSNIDNLMRQFKENDLSFFNHFSYSRLIVDRGFRYKKPAEIEENENQEAEDNFKTESEIEEIVQELISKESSTDLSKSIG